MELINNFIKTINNQSNQKWEDFVNEQRQKDINKIIAKEQLKKDKTYDFLKSSFKNGEVKIIGTEISELLPNMSRFTKDQAREQKKWRVWKEFINIFKKYSDISNISLM
jgi:type I restriction enzyme R subunit